MIESYSLRFIHLFPERMNIYGDCGNVIAIQKRCEWRGIGFEYSVVNNETEFEKVTDGDMYFFGGGQDQDQAIVWDIITKQKDMFLKNISDAVEANKVFLLICGGYQMFGRSFLDSSGNSIQGLGILDIETRSPGARVNDRCIGNIVVETNLPITPPTLVGFENHGGQTQFCIGSGKQMEYLGKVIKGYGNDRASGFEGCRYRNVIGTYMHGSLLPKNPHLADYLIAKALEVRYGHPVPLSPLDNSVEMRAHKSTIDIIM